MTKLLGPAEIRELAERLGVSPTKRRGQNFLHDPNTIRRIVATAKLDPSDVVIEVGPGLGSLTLGLLPAAAHVHAVEIDPKLAEALVETTGHPANLTVHNVDALHLSAEEFDPEPTAFVANLPYNVAVPVLLNLLAALPSVAKGLVMVQKEVADRLTAGPGSRIYGVPSVKLAWYASSRSAGKISPAVFWPVPNVDSGLVAFERRDPPRTDVPRAEVFAVVDAAFAQRRKTLRAALAGWAGSAAEAERLLRAAGIDPSTRGEQLDVISFAKLAAIRLAR
ncbi:MAG TPA: 16S rRNA (adenine(1518)-N(6)/adenine(1519)-N(6))-dimethyltransferase [Micromonosporaceae bacterium]|nr:16S rRNA (adenine(1518)-N(6)/adenine(1519)-N(6))-dimethyltransferase [Micromonosporaceae bacterium]HCU49891.1 16S rRNA (adenine(1518)-N(6)/adenine(1519)-N(6))-dimethyltransferase [Micromonosporaceae bacterium]